MPVHWSIEKVQDYQTSTQERYTVKEMYDHYGMSMEELTSPAEIYWAIKHNQRFMFDDDTVTDQTATLDSIVSAWRPVTRWLIDVGLSVSHMQSITPKNYRKLHQRLLIVGFLHPGWRPQRFVLENPKGERWNYYDITLEEVKAHIGMWTNRSEKTDASFWKEMREDLEGWARRESNRQHTELTKEQEGGEA